MDRRNFFGALAAAIASPSILAKVPVPDLLMGIDPASAATFSVLTSATHIHYEGGIINFVNAYSGDKWPVSEASIIKVRQENLNKYFNEVTRHIE